MQDMEYGETPGNFDIGKFSLRFVLRIQALKHTAAGDFLVWAFFHGIRSTLGPDSDAKRVFFF